MTTQRTDAESRVDAMASHEYSRVQSVMAALTSNPMWLDSMGRMAGKTPRELEVGLSRFSETIRRLDLECKSIWNPDFYGAGKLFRRCETERDRMSNIREIASFVDRNRLDKARVDTDSIFFDPELTQQDPTRFRILKQRLGFWEDFLPTLGIDVGARETSYRMYEGTGETQASSPGRQGGVPYVGVKNEQYFNPVETSLIGYQLTTDDQRKAAYGNEPLLEELLLATRQAIRRQLDKTAWLGNDDLGLIGMVNHPGVSNRIANAPASGSDRTWFGGDKTNDEIYLDIVDSLAQISKDSKENWRPEDTLFMMLLDRTNHDKLKVRMATGTDTTLRDFIESGNRIRLGVLPDEFILGTGPGGTNQALIYPMDTQVLRYRVNPDILWAPMQWVDLTMKFPGELIHGGMEVIYPIAMLELFNI